MAKKPKGFGQPVKSKSKRKASSKTTPPKSISLSLAPLRDTELLEQKEARLKQIFDASSSIPIVSNHSLKDYYQYLQANLASAIPVLSEEPFAWENSYVYGRGTAEAHQLQRQQYPSYLDRFQLIALSSTIQNESGIQVEVKRVGDNRTFMIPLSKLKLEQSSDIYFDSTIADYCFWWWNYRSLRMK